MIDCIIVYITGWATVDGEHENDNGAAIVAELFGNELLAWLKNKFGNK